MERRIIIAGGGNRGFSFAKTLELELKRPVAAIAENDAAKHPGLRKSLDEAGMKETQLFISLDKALATFPRSQTDIVFVMTPDWTHLEVARKAVKAGCHIFLEKPLETTREKILGILELSESTDKLIQVGFVLRYATFVRKVKEIIDSGVLGTIAMIQMNERLSLKHGGTVFCRSWHRKIENTGGFLNEKCSHDLDLMCWYKSSQAQPAEVFSHGGRHFTPFKSEMPETCDKCQKAYCPWRIDKAACVFRADGDIMDHQCVNIRFSDGTQGLFTNIEMSPVPGRDIRIFGSDGYLEGELENGIIRVKSYWDDSPLKEVPLGATDAHGGGDTRIIAEFLDCVDKHERPLSTVADGAQASLIALAAEKSVVKGAAVSLVKDMRALDAVRKKAARKAASKKRLTGKLFADALIVEVPKAKAEAGAFVVANPSGWPVEATLKVKAKSAETSDADGKREKLEPLNGELEIALRPHECKSGVLSGGDLKISGSSVKAARSCAAELETFAKEKAKIYGNLAALDEKEMESFAAALHSSWTAKTLRAIEQAVLAEAKKENWLALAGKISSYDFHELEKTLSVISPERRKGDFGGKLAIVCGASKDLVDGRGGKWLAPQPWLEGFMPWGCLGGSQVSRGEIKIDGTAVPEIYRQEQYGIRGYRFRVENGSWKVRLHFAETWYASSGSRHFDIKIQDATVVKDLDVFKEAGGKNKALVKELRAEVENGVLAVDLAPFGDALLNALEVEKL